MSLEWHRPYRYVITFDPRVSSCKWKFDSCMTLKWHSMDIAILFLLRTRLENMFISHKAGQFSHNLLRIWYTKFQSFPPNTNISPESCYHITPFSPPWLSMSPGSSLSNFRSIKAFLCQTESDPIVTLNDLGLYLILYLFMVTQDHPC